MPLVYEPSPDYNRCTMETQLEIGALAPNFRLQDLKGYDHTLAQYRGWVVLLNFWSAECPWSERVDRLLGPHLNRWQPEVVYLPLAVNLNEPQDMLEFISEKRSIETVLRDGEQIVADLYGAQTTPHFFLVDRQGLLRYQGAYDDVTFRQRLPTRLYVVEVVEALLRGEEPPVTQTPAYGCAIVRALG